MESGVGTAGVGSTDHPAPLAALSSLRAGWREGTALRRASTIRKGARRVQGFTRQARYSCTLPRPVRRNLRRAGVPLDLLGVTVLSIGPIFICGLVCGDETWISEFNKN